MPWLFLMLVTVGWISPKAVIHQPDASYHPSAQWWITPSANPPYVIALDQRDLLRQVVKVIPQVIVNKAGDEVVGMVIAGLHAQGNWHAGFLAGGGKRFRL